MTLVVAERFATGMSLIGDTKLTYRDERERCHPDAFGQGALKVVVLHKSLTVGWAGDPQVALPAIRGLGVNAGTPFDGVEVSRALRRVARHSGATFIVASRSPVPTLTRIAGSRVESVARGTYIGEPAAYAAYETERLRLRPEGGISDLDAMKLMSRAMAPVIESQAHATVGGLRVVVRADERGPAFSYHANQTLHSGSQQVPAGVSYVSWAAPALGAFTASILTPQQPGVGALGVYFEEGNCGLVFYPTVFDGGRLVAAVSEEAFRARVASDFPFRLNPGLVHARGSDPG